MRWRTVKRLLYPVALVVADKTTTVECLRRGYVELNPLALNPLFPLFQFFVLVAATLGMEKLCEKLCPDAGEAERRLPVLTLHALLLYPVANNVLNLLADFF